jgi:aminoglycoside 2''-phosphotransferase
MSPEQIEQIIKENYPDFHVETCVLAGEGDDSIAYTVNGNYIFRFSKNQIASKNLEKEIKILPSLKERLSIPIPEFEFIGTNSARKFVGYKKLIGERLDENFKSLSQSDRQKIAVQLASFIQTLRNFPLEPARLAGIEEINYKNEITKDLKKWDEMFGTSEPKLKQFLHHVVEEYLDNPDKYKYQPVLLHADLSGDHIFYDKSTMDIAGIIDFGDLRIGDPDNELNYFYEEFGEEFAKMILAELGDTNPKIIDKLKLFDIVGLLDEMVDGQENGDEEKVRVNYERLKQYANG